MNFFPEARSVCPQFVRTAVTRGDLFYIFPGFQPNPELSGDIRLYITLMMKMDKLLLPSAGSKVFGLEVCNNLVLFYEHSSGPFQVAVVTGLVLCQILEQVLGTNFKPVSATERENVSLKLNWCCLLSIFLDFVKTLLVGF